MATAITTLPYLFQPGLQEVLGWKTKVITSNNGKEQRMKLRRSPRQEFSFNIAIPRGEVTKLDSLLFAQRGTTFGIPVSSECRTLNIATSASSPNVNTDTDFGDFRVGGQIMIYNSPTDFELLEIDSFTQFQIIATTNVSKIYDINALVIPIRTARLMNNPVRSTNGDLARLNANFLVTDNISLTVAASAIQYKGIDVYLDEPLTIGDFASDNYTADVNVIDFGTGVSEIFSPWLKPKIQRTFGVQLDNLEEIWTFREWLHRREGKLRPFWMPTFEDNFTLLSTGALTTTLLVVNDNQDTRSTERKDIAIKISSGWILREILSIVPSGDDLLITLDSSIAIDASDIELLSFLGRKRLAADRIEIQFEGNNTASAVVPILELNNDAALTSPVGVDSAFCPSVGLRVTQSVIEVLHSI